MDQKLRYLVVGGAGYLGSHLVDLLMSEGHEVVILDNFSGNVTTNFTENALVIDGSITNLTTLEELERLNDISGVFNVAAKKSVSESLLIPLEYEKTNVEGNQNILNYCGRMGIKNFVFTSSAAVYGEVETSNSINEQEMTNPINPYGASKRKAEIAIAQFCASYPLKAISLRVFNMVGARKNVFLDKKGENVLPIMLASLNRSIVFKVNGDDFATIDGTCVRDYVSVHDVANAHLLAMRCLEKEENFGNQVINVSSGAGTSVLELISILNNQTEKPLIWEFTQRREGDPSSVIGNNDLAREILGWEPTISIEQSIYETVTAFEEA